MTSLIAFALAASFYTTEKVEILRDEFGVPHIFAKTDVGADFGSGYAQAEDRLEELLKNYRRAEGTMSEVFGPQFYPQDYRQRLLSEAAGKYPRHDGGVSIRGRTVYEREPGEGTGLGPKTRPVDAGCVGAIHHLWMA